MQALAEYIMRSRKQAVVVAIAANAIPMLFWLGAATVGLVILRTGFRKGLPTLLWSTIPALFWASQSSPIALLCVLGTALMAHCLRQTSSWVTTLALLVPLGAITVWVMMTLYTPVLMQTITSSQQMSSQLLSHLVANSASMDSQQLKVTLTTVLIKGYTFATLVFMLLALSLARNWQATLYNPGGFREEFHKLRLPTLFAGPLLCLWLLGIFSNNSFIQAMLPGLFLPLVFAGIALTHGLIAIKGSKQARSLLVIVYLLLLIVYPLVIVLACFDSFADFRSKLAKRLANKAQ